MLETGKEHDETTESTSGPIGGQSCTTFAVESCLSFQVNRSGVLDDSRQQSVGGHTTRDSLRNLYVASFCSFSEECYLFLLSPFELFGLFFFSFIFTLCLLSHSHFLVLYHKILLISSHPGSCLYSSLLSPLVPNINSSCFSFLLAFFVQKFSQLLCRFQ